MDIRSLCNVCVCSHTSRSYLERDKSAGEDPQAARLQELVDYVQAQVRPKQFWDIVEIVL
jgi:hypothetical protein